MKKLPFLRDTPLWFYPVGLVATGAVAGALLVVWSVIPVVLIAFAVGWLNGAYLASTRKKIAELFERLPVKHKID